MPLPIKSSRVRYLFGILLFSFQYLSPEGGGSQAWLRLIIYLEEIIISTACRSGQIIERSELVIWSSERFHPKKLWNLNRAVVEAIAGRLAERDLNVWPWSWMCLCEGAGSVWLLCIVLQANPRQMSQLRWPQCSNINLVATGSGFLICTLC